MEVLLSRVTGEGFIPREQFRSSVVPARVLPIWDNSVRVTEKEITGACAKVKTRKSSEF